jgi:hypothetical protein
MTFTPIPKGTQNWDVPVNAAFAQLDSDIISSAGDSLQAADNLSDLSNIAQARTNLGLSLGAVVDGEVLNVKDHGALGNGAADDYAAIQATLNAAYTDSATIPRGAIVLLPPGNYRTSAPLIVPPYVTLKGSYAMRGTNIQQSIIKPLSSFSGTSVISMVDATTGGYSTTSEGQRLVDITIDGSVLPGTTTGVAATGLVHGVVMHNVSIDKVTDRGVQSISNGSGHPYSWYLDNVQVSTATLDGFRFSSMTDTTMIGCRAIGCGRRGYYLDGMANSTFTACRSEFAGENGWYITSSWGTGTGSGGAIWTGCTTDRSNNNGFLVDATGSATLVFNGLVLRRDGRNGNAGGGSYAGFNVSAATTPVYCDGLTVYPGVDDNGSGVNSPERGFNASGSTWVNLSSGYLHAATTAFNDGGTNTFLQKGPGVGLATGTTASPTRSTTETWNFAGPVTATAGGYIASRGATANTAFEALVTGDSVTRFNVDATGKATYGSGSATRDANWYRGGAGYMQTDNSIYSVGPSHGIVSTVAHSAIAWTYDPSNIASGKAGTAGTLYLAAVYVPRVITATKLFWGINTAGASITAAENFVGLYNSAGTQMASVGVDARVTTTGMFTETISAALTPGLYWVAFLFNATTMPAVYRAQDLNSTVLNFNTTAATTRYGTNGTGLIALPGSITPASNTSAQFSYWAAIG